MKSNNFSRYSLFLCVCEQLLGGARARLCNAGCAAVPTVSPGCHWDREQEGHWNITSMLGNKYPSLPYCSTLLTHRNVLVYLWPVTTAQGRVLCAGIISSRNTTKVLFLVSLLEPSAPVGTLLSFPDKAEAK